MNGHSNGTNGHSNGMNGHSEDLESQSNGINGHSNNHPNEFDEPRIYFGHDNGSGSNGATGLGTTVANDNNGINGTNGLLKNGHSGSTNTNGTHTNGNIDSDKTNGTGAGFQKEGIETLPTLQKPFQPVAICGMACRLPGGVHSPSELWSFPKAGGDARGPAPSSRYNISAFHSPDKKPGSIIAREGYFLDSTNDLAALDTTFFSMSRNEVETLDPQQRMLLEVTHEALDDAGERGWKGSSIGVYVGSYGQD